MRQTNVIWVAFTATLHGYNLLTDALDEEKLNLPEKVFFSKQNKLFFIMI